MNKNCFRVIFNQARGIMMVVAENAKSHTANADSKSTSSPHVDNPQVAISSQATLRPLTLAMLSVLGGVNLAHAEITADQTAPGNQHAIILSAPKEFR